MLFKEVIELENKSRKKLEDIIKCIYKSPSNSTLYDKVIEIIDSIKNKGCWESCRLKITPITKEVEYEYTCKDKEELKEMLEDYRDMVIKKEELNLIIKDTVIIDYSLESSSNIFDVVTVEEGANLLKISKGAIRKAISCGRLKVGEDYRKAGRITLINKNSLFRVFK